MEINIRQTAIQQVGKNGEHWEPRYISLANSKLNV